MPVRELIIGYVMLFAMALVGTFVIRSRNHGVRGLLHIRWALLAALVGLVFMFLRGSVPVVIVSVFGQTAFLVGSALLYAALARALGHSSRLFPFLAILLPAFVAGLCYFSLANNNLIGRLVVASVGIAAILAWTVFLAARSSHQEFRIPLRWLFGLLLVLIALRLLRVAAVFLLSPNPDLQVLSPVHVLLIHALVLGSLAQTAITFWISICARREDDRVRADTDGLTGLLNRRAFEESLAGAIREAGQEAAASSLLLVDIDFFKKVNDESGHLAGDAVLRRVSEVLRRSVRPTDALARFGGDEFAALLLSAGPERGMQVAERIRQSLTHMRHLPGGRHITASLGVATSLPGDTPLLLIERADRALYRSKNSGRNRLTHFDQDDLPGADKPLQSAFIQ